MKKERVAYHITIPYHKAGHSGRNIASNITHPKKSLLTWHVFNEERDGWSNIICYCNITHLKAK